MKYKKTSHSIYVCDCHIVFPAKYGRKVINSGIFAYIDLRLKEIGKHYPQIEIKETNHDEDHIHLFISIPPQMSVGSAIRIIKFNTSRSLKQKFPFLKEVYWGIDGIWSDGYFVSTVGTNESTIRKYIEYQSKGDSGQAVLEVD